MRSQNRIAISFPGKPAHQIIHGAIERDHLAVVRLLDVYADLLVQMLQNGEKIKRIDIDLLAHRPIGANLREIGFGSDREDAVDQGFTDIITTHAHASTSG